MNETESVKARPVDLARELMGGIASGRFAVGSFLPTELELCEQYATSRYAVRLALAELQQRGLVSRRKNVGTRVEAASPTTNYRPSLASIEDLVQFGATHERIVRRVGEVKSDGMLSAMLGCPPGTRLLRISSVRADTAAGGKTVGWTDVYIDAAYADVGEMARSNPDTLISSLIEQQHGRRIAHIHQDIDAVAMPAAAARELGVEPGSPALKVVRRYLDDDGVPFEVSVTLHPSGRFTFSMELTRSQGGMA